MSKIVVCGGGGFIGGHLIARLRQSHGHHNLKAVDIKPLDRWQQRSGDIENVVADLRDPAACYRACIGADDVYNLAADMGGIGFIEANKAACMISVLINTHLLLAARDCGVGRYFYASSACVYAADKQAAGRGSYELREEDAYPAMAEDGYGWEKLFSERMCRHFGEDYGMNVRVARFHNSYGPHGTWRGGREKAPAAICRKVIEAVRSGKGQIEIWGDGRQRRSFMWIGDNIDGILKIMDRDIAEPINLGSSEMVTINELVDVVEQIAGVRLHRKYDATKPRGVHGRSSDNTRLRSLLDGWEPSTPLRIGLARTYEWIESQQLAKGHSKSNMTTSVAGG